MSREQRIHENSLEAYREEKEKLSQRCKDILSVITENGNMTDREVCNLMKFPDMNCVRPRITELCQANLLRQIGVVKCPQTDKSVRVVRAIAESEVSSRDQMIMDFGLGVEQ